MPGKEGEGRVARELIVKVCHSAGLTFPHFCVRCLCSNNTARGQWPQNAGADQRGHRIRKWATAEQDRETWHRTSFGAPKAILFWISYRRLQSAGTNTDEGHQGCQRAGAQGVKRAPGRIGLFSHEEKGWGGRGLTAACNSGTRGYIKEERVRLFSEVHAAGIRGNRHKLAYRVL